MTGKIQIKDRYIEGILYECEVPKDVKESEKLKYTVEQAVKEGDELWGADLEGANLRGTNLRGADLRGADLEDVKIFSGWKLTRDEG